MAYRANLFSAAAAAAAVGVAVLILVRLGVRPVIAAGAGLALAFTGTLWQEATFSEMNGLHLLIVALLLHRALVWRAERRAARPPARRAAGRPVRLEPRPGHHGRAVRDPVRAGRRPPRARGARRGCSSGPLPGSRSGSCRTSTSPLRASFGPPEVYAPFLTWNGFFGHVSGAQFRSDMHFLSLDSVNAAWVAMPKVVEHLVSTSNVGLRRPRRRRAWSSSSCATGGSGCC